MKNMSKAILLISGLVCLLQTVIGYSQSAIAIDPRSEVTEDGLIRVDPFVMGAAWVKSDINLSRYTKLYFMPVVVQYRDVPEVHNQRRKEGGEVFVASDSLKAIFENSFGEYFHEAVSSVSSYQLSENVGRDVLLIQAYLTDVITAVPPDLPAAYTTTIRWLWEAGVVLELRDSMTGEILARTADRRRADGPVDANLAWTFTPRATLAWSNLLIRRLEEIGDLTGRADFWPLVVSPEE
tara:strand:- start:1242 stop:1955 length:714 start_codon:yes stop_codon:yes gene_type:complete